MKRKMDVDNTALPPIEYAAVVRGFSRFAASKISAEYAFLALSPLLWLKNSTKETIMTGTMTSFLLNSLKIISLVLRERLQASCIYIYIYSVLLIVHQNASLAGVLTEIGHGLCHNVLLAIVG